MKLLSNFYQVGGTALSHRYDASVYLLRDERGLLLVDCGTPEGYGQIRSNIADLGFDPSDVHTILATHGHYDHVGAAYLWKNDFGCRLLLDERDREAVETGDSAVTSAELLYGTAFTPVRVDGGLEEGEQFLVQGGSMEVLHTPGHTPGSVSFVLEMDGVCVLIAGDSVWGGFSEKIHSSESAWKESLEKITSRHFDFYTFGHIGPVLLSDADRRLREARGQFANYYNPWFKRFDTEYVY